MRDKSDLYYECHITIEPPNEVTFIPLQDICAEYGFRLARFSMLQHGENAKGFISARGQSYSFIFRNMTSLITMLQANGYKILRYKIEDTIIDSNNDSDEVLRLLK